jgi:hypothetical protein
MFGESPRNSTLLAKVTMKKMFLPLILALALGGCADSPANRQRIQALGALGDAMSGVGEGMRGNSPRGTEDDAPPARVMHCRNTWSGQRAQQHPGDLVCE